MHLIAREKAERIDGATAALTGFPVAFGNQARLSRFLLAAEPPCCPGCAPSGSVEVELRQPIATPFGQVQVTGRWQGGVLCDARLDQPPGWSGLTRRKALLAGPLMCLPAGSRALAADVLATAAPVDLHSHAGGIANPTRMRLGGPFSPVGGPMRTGRMAAACLAIVSDATTHRLMADNRLHPFRDPERGELYAYAQTAFKRLHEMVAEQGMRIVTGASGLSGDAPGAVIASEGADFLEGLPDRVDEAHARWSLRHLQLVHYRVNELGDIQTEPPVHGGLTPTWGAEVIRRCNKIGVVVDVAHGTFDLVKRAVAVTTKPLVLSHTSLTARPSQFTRLVVAEHAKLVADTGGVVGVWPPELIFPTLNALAAGIARMVDAIGIDHVGLGSDIRGLTDASVFPDYDRMPALTQALLDAGFSQADTAKLIGGNYARVFQACVGG